MTAWSREVQLMARALRLLADVQKCVQCGYCCTVAPCSYGEWDENANRCMFLNSDNQCQMYDIIRQDPGSVMSPAFGAGCSSSLFNQVREAKIRSMVEAGDVKESLRKRVG